MAAAASSPSMRSPVRGRVGVALRGQHHAHRGVGGEAGLGAQPTRGRLGQQAGEVLGEPGQDDLGLGVAEAHVVLEDTRARRR